MSFDVLAPHYRWLEWVLAGTKLQRCRTTYLAEVRRPSRILIAGEGNGRFLVECGRAFPQAAITVIDASVGMLKQAEKRLVSSGLPAHRVSFVHGNILNWELQNAAHDFVVTHFFLDCFDEAELQNVVSRLSAAASADAQWLIADFQMPSVGWQKWRAQLIHALMYAFFRPVTKLSARRVVPPQPFLETAGFTRTRSRRFNWGLLGAELWERKVKAATFASPKLAASGEH